MSKSVLIVDDEEATREILQIILEMTGYQVYSAEDGEDALEKVANHLPDIILLDMMMPKMDGLTVCRHLRDQPQTAHLPIIILSGNSFDRVERQSLAAGANCFLAKPIDPEDLLAHMEQLLMPS